MQFFTGRCQGYSFSVKFTVPPYVKGTAYKSYVRPAIVVMPGKRKMRTMRTDVPGEILRAQLRHKSQELDGDAASLDHRKQ